MKYTSLDPDYLPLLEFFPTFELSEEILPQVRQQFSELMPPLDTADPNVQFEEISVPSYNSNHQIRALLYRHKNASDCSPALVQIHGGGHVTGCADQDDAGNRELARMIKGTVLAVDYRLAPETSYPGPIDDCYSALLWLFHQAKHLRIDPQRIGVIGTSAGGGLAACLCLMARDKGEVPVAFQGLLMPMLDNLTVAREEASPNPFVGQYIWTREHNLFAWQAMLGDVPNDSNVPCYASAARATDLAGLPPTYLGIGALDLLAEETLSYAQRLLMAGVTVDCHIYGAAPHAYSAAPEASAARSEQLLLQSFLDRVFQNS